ncbi:Piwi-domain-containing protein [Coprinellus micaceus]|uniref:Piwi-domain-containing protein n=1 Tax=Coprinellus micaceus TaxID=71717 RepID=A0A4Y7TPQ9_COPMI|nr:Piwi-domain-containing protein [Coprinellus micaceus]
MSRYQQQQQQGPPRHPQQQHRGGPTAAQVTTNCFEITRLPARTFYMYDAFKPDIPKSAWRKRAELVHHLRSRVTPEPFHPIFLYDGGAIGFAHPTAAQALGGFRSFPVRLRDNGVPAPDARNVTLIEFKRTAGSPITSTEINEVVIQGQDSPRRSSLVNFMQLVVRHSFNNMHANNGKAYFPQKPELIRATCSGLELRKGIFHSVRPAIGRMLIVVDTTVAAFWKSDQLITTVMAVVKTNDVRFVERLCKSDRDLNKLKRFLRGVFIREKKGGRIGPRRSIKGFHRDGAYYEFENDDGMSITIADHYRRVHSLILNYPKLPGVILREGDKLEIVPMETCTIEPDQLFKKVLPDEATRDMVSTATLRPQQKLDAITRAAGDYGAADGLFHAEMEVKNQPMRVNATVLNSAQNPDVARGQWNLLKQRFFKTTTTRDSKCHWAVLNMGASMLSGKDPVENLVIEFMDCANNLGLNLERPSAREVLDPAAGPVKMTEVWSLPHAPLSIRKHGIEAFKKMMNNRMFFIFCILDKEAADARATLKNWGDVQRGVLTQCVRVTKLNFRSKNAASQYFNNVALKVNARLGGENSRVVGPQTYRYLTEQNVPTMIVGADVSHPAPGIRKPSVTSLVYNHDQFATQYTAVTRLQDPRLEVITDLKDMMKDAMQDLMMNVARQPIKNIVFFRDGVSEGEYEKIREVEIGAINGNLSASTVLMFSHSCAEAIHELWTTIPNLANPEKATGKPPSKPKLSFIVVGKRHHTLMFPASQGSGVDDGKTGNCKAGVVVNSEITQPTIGDFYLLSHSAIIGTSRSSHYIILQDDVFNNQGTDALQELSFALCHNYAKATRSVSIPAPVYCPSTKLINLWAQTPILLAAETLSISLLVTSNLFAQATWARWRRQMRRSTSMRGRKNSETTTLTPGDR